MLSSSPRAYNFISWSPTHLKAVALQIAVCWLQRITGRRRTAKPTEWREIPDILAHDITGNRGTSMPVSWKTNTNSWSLSLFLCAQIGIFGARFRSPCIFKSTSQFLATFHIEVWLFKALRCGGWIWPSWQRWDGPRHVMLYNNLSDDCGSNPKTTSCFEKQMKDGRLSQGVSIAQACTWDLRYLQGKSEQKYRVAPHSFPWVSGRFAENVDGCRNFRRYP